MMRAKSKFFRLIVILFLSAIVSSCIYDHRRLPRLDSEEANAVKALKKMVKGGVYTGSEITDESERDSGNRMVKHVTYLTIRSRYMDDKAVFILANFKHLKYLTMVNSCVTYRGVEDLCDLLPDYSGFVIKNTRNRDLEEPNSYIKENLEVWISPEYYESREVLKESLRPNVENANQQTNESPEANSAQN